MAIRRNNKNRKSNKNIGKQYEFINTTGNVYSFDLSETLFTEGVENKKLYTEGEEYVKELR